MPDEELDFQEGPPMEEEPEQCDLEMPDTPGERRELFVKLKRAEKKLKAELEELSDRLMVLGSAVMTDLQNEDVQSLKLVGGVTLYVHKEVYAKVIDKERLVDTFEAHGLRDMLTINSQTLSSYLREQLAESEELPQWMAQVIEPATRFSPRLRGLK